MQDDRKTTFKALIELAEEMKYGTIPVTLIVHEGRIIGFDKSDPSLIRFRENEGNKARHK